MSELIDIWTKEIKESMEDMKREIDEGKLVIPKIELPDEKNYNDSEENSDDENNEIDENEKTCSCGICPVKKGDKECSICLKYLCHSIRPGQSACSLCLLEAIDKGTLQKNEKGQWLDPLMYPLTTCICGELYTPMSGCMFKMFQGDKNHKFIN